MPRVLRSARGILIIVVCLRTAPAPAGPQIDQSPGKNIRSGVSAIVVDAVVRDGKGRPVTDLRKQDFELLEDGVPQEIGDVTVVMPGPTRDGRGAIGPSSPPDTSGGMRARARSAAPSPSFLAMVFDRLSPDARLLAYKGALAYLDRLHESDYAAVYLSDLKLTTVQTYTNDRARLRNALREVASHVTSSFDRDAVHDPLQNRDDRGNPLPGDAHPSVDVVASAESVGRPVDTRNGTAMRELMALELGTHVSWEAIARDQQGYATTNALLAVTTGLGALPGRKSVVFFAEGLSIPDAVLPHFRSVVTNANRGNVTVYTIDAAGLRVHSKDAETGREVRAMGIAGINGWSSIAMMERNEDVLRKDPRTSLTLLAEQTGGFLVDSTNDLGSAFRQIDGDRRFHYLLIYTPKNGNFDGRWRSIAVRIPGRRVQIRARSGYLAVHSPATLPLLAYEGPALAALDRLPAPSDIPLRAAALVFPDGAHSRIAVLAATDANTIRFGRDVKAQTYHADFSILARIVDSRGEVVRKASQPYHLSGPVQQLDAAQRGEVLFFKQPIVEPGQYTLEVAIHDTFANTASVRRESFTVPDVVSQALEVSSLVLVRRAERVTPAERQKDNPLYVGDVLVYPNLGEPISKASDKALTFLIVIGAGSGAPPQATVEILRERQTLGQAASPLPRPDESGRIRHIAQVPVDTLAPGRYALRLTVTQGDRRELRETDFVLID